MKEVSFSLVDRLLGWDDNLRLGDHSLDQWAIETLLSDCHIEGVPIIFYAPGSEVAVQLALKAGVDFTLRNRDGESVLFDGSHLDLAAFRSVAESFARQGKIDTPEAEGLTALSAQVKFGNLGKARILLELGASPAAFATIARYGNARLSIPQQAIHVVSAVAPAAKESLSIALLSLLKEFGMRLEQAEKSDLSRRAQRGSGLQDWIESNL